MSITTRSVDKACVIAAIVGSFSCAACFPAAASIGAAIGLGFLSQWESLLVHSPIPIFALVVLLANLMGWFTHRQGYRTLAGAIGPLVALIGAFGLMGVFGMTHGFLPREYRARRVRRRPGRHGGCCDRRFGLAGQALRPAARFAAPGSDSPGIL